MRVSVFLDRRGFEWHVCLIFEDGHSPWLNVKVRRLNWMLDAVT